MWWFLVLSAVFLASGVLILVFADGVSGFVRSCLQLMFGDALAREPGINTPRTGAAIFIVIGVAFAVVGLVQFAKI